MGVALLGVVSLAIKVYLFLIFIYILASWFPGSWTRSRPVYWLTQLVTPYLNWFRRVSFLRVGMFDFSPMLGIALLYFVQSLIEALKRTRGFSFGIVVSSAVGLVIGLLNSLLTIFFVLLIIRLLAVFFDPRGDNQFYRILDQVAAAIYRRTVGNFTKNKPSKSMLLITAILMMGLAYALLNYGLRLLLTYLN